MNEAKIHDALDAIIKLCVASEVFDFKIEDEEQYNEELRVAILAKLQQYGVRLVVDEDDIFGID